jgi:chromosome segregation ATPase
MTHSPDSGDGPAVFDREFLLLDDLIRDGSHLEFEQLKSVVADAEFERAEAEGKARRAEARAKRLAKQLEQTAAQRDGALRQVAEVNVREGELSSTVLGLRLALGEAEGERDMVRAALARVVAAVMNGAHDPLGDALDVLEATGGTVPALSSRHLLAVAA